MLQKPLVTLIVLAICLKAVAGGHHGYLTICLGGGHEHAPAEADVASCELACSHESQRPAPVPGDLDGHDDDGCECTDIELALLNLLVLPRSADDVAVPPATTVVGIVAIVEATAPPPRVRARRPESWHEPGGGHALAVVRSTRLLL
ncbi:MAG: hypothetical protein ACYTJ0_11735 [Planctomycetota bacterium]|jgi:hypothetical protein